MLGFFETDAPSKTESTTLPCFAALLIPTMIYPNKLGLVGYRHHSLFALPGAHIRHGETWRQAAHRGTLALIGASCDVRHMSLLRTRRDLVRGDMMVALTAPIDREEIGDGEVIDSMSSLHQDIEDIYSDFIHLFFAGDPI